MIAASWKTRYEKTAAAVLCFRGGREENTAFEKDRTSVFDFARRVGVLLLGGTGQASPELVPDRRMRTRSSPAPRPPRPAPAMTEDGIVGESSAWRYVMFRVEQVAETQATVLLLGETGTGKEIVARAIHRRSTRRHNRFVALNCSALPATLIESELFGRERGAFTGASMSQAGRFELAHRGTLFLDEAGDLPLELQPKLLRVLQEGQLDRLGSTHTTTVDVRVIAATNRDLLNDVRNDRFRRDLYYRLNVFPITLPALRERAEDIPLLAQYFLEKFSRQLRKPVEPISKSVMRVLQDHHWPGNIRELENVIQRAIILSSGGSISTNDVCLSTLTDPVGAMTPPTGETTLQSVERDHILRILASTSWRIEGPRGAARALGLKPSTLRSRLQKLSIRRAS
jgi:transcriptional regulator with GAF, ATPase, and Fis domain